MGLCARGHRRRCNLYILCFDSLQKPRERSESGQAGYAHRAGGLPARRGLLTVLEYITETLKKRKMHMTLIDPEKQDPKVSGEIAAKACRAGTDAIMVGGSTGVTQENLDKTVEHIKNNCKLPVIYFPSGANAIARKCDAIYFMSMLNSKN